LIFSQATHYRWIILVIFALDHLILSIAGYGWGPISPFLKKAMSLNSTQIGCISSTFFLTAALSSLPAGFIVDYYGVKKGIAMWLGFTGVPLLFLYMLKPGFVIFLMIVAISGFGYGMGTPIGAKGLFMWFEQNLRGIVFGIKQAAVTVGASFSGILLVFFSETMGPYNSLGIIGFVVVVMMIASLLLYRDPIRSENISKHTIMCENNFFSQFKKFLTNRYFLHLSIIMSLFGLSQGIVVTFLILYTTEKLGYSFLAAGSLLTLVMISGAVGRILWGFISDRLYNGQRKPVMIIISFLAVITVTALSVWDVSWSSWLFMPVLIGLGLATVGWNSLGLVMVAEVSDESEIGISIGLATTIGWLGFSAGPVAFGNIVDHFGYSYAWTSLMGFCIFSLILCFLLPVNNLAKVDDQANKTHGCPNVKD